MRLPERILSLTWCTAALSVTGFSCSSFWPERHLELELDPPEVTVVYVPGMLGVMMADVEFARGIRDAGIVDVRKFEWTTPLFPVNLSSQSLHERKASDLVEFLCDIHSELPEQRIIVASHSAGAHVVLLAVEQLAQSGRDEVNIEQWWMIAPALSPERDLTTALDTVPRVVSVQTNSDWLLLGLGTTVFGSADRHHGSAAGRIGFAEADERLEVWILEELEESSDHTGRGHLGGLRRSFARERVASSMIQWNEDASEN